MTRSEGKRYSSVIRMFLFLIVFIFALILQLSLSGKRNKDVLAPMLKRSSNEQVISDTLSYVEELNKYLSQYRWDYGDLSELLIKKREFLSNTSSKVDSIKAMKGALSEEEFVLAEATTTTYSSFIDYLDDVIELQLENLTTKAKDLYYDEVQSCGEYLAKYIRSLLESHIQRSSEINTKLSLLNDFIGRLQSLTLILMVIFGCFVVHDFVQIISSMDIFAKAAKEIGKGNLNYPDVEVRGSEEIENLAAVFNEMKHSMQTAVSVLEDKHRMEIELKEKENEAIEFESILEREKLQKLRSQINPHFLFNTLNLIVYSAKQENATNTENLLRALSNLFRYSLASNDFYVPLSSEIKIVNEFYLLYHERFGSRILLEWHVSDDVELTETYVPSFILQPLVENSFRHGLLSLESGGRVDIFVTDLGDEIKIVVQDNGVGMDADTLKLVRERLTEHSSSGEHLGLYNVAARLRLGENGRIKVDSEPGFGSNVELIIKKMEECDVQNIGR